MLTIRKEPKKVTISMRVTERQNSWLKKIAKANKVSVSMVVQQLIEDAMDADEGGR